MVSEISLRFWYLKMLTNMVICYTFFSVLQIGIFPWYALWIITFKSLQHIVRINMLIEQPEP